MTLPNPKPTPQFPVKSDNYEDLESRTSRHKGPMGMLERMLRRFRRSMFYVLLAPVAFLYVLALGLSSVPGIWLFSVVLHYVGTWSWLAQGPILGLTLALSGMLFWFSMIFVVPILNLPFLPFVKPGRGIWYSLQTIPWYYHNALTQLARYTVLDFLTPTPFNLIFYRLMGMKMGRNCVINTSNISDPCLITLEDNVTIGGSATLFAHYGMKGYLIIKPVLIKSWATIGLKVSIMGGVTVGTHQTVPPGLVLMPNSVLPDL